MSLKLSRSDKRAASWFLVLGVIAVLEGIPFRAAAFPGESAMEMIVKHGAPSLPASVELPPKALLQAGKSPSVLVVWFNTKYHPLALPLELEGRVVASFRFDRESALRRIKQGESYAMWDDLRSDFENLFTSLTAEQFQQFLTALNRGWTVTNITHHQEPPYDLYEAVSRDGKLKAEFSFRAPHVPSPSANDPYYGGKFPDGNFWVRVQRIKT
ncbi:MAG: hypothetical protein AB1555_15490 [Nitrospirota bacterium]